MLDLSDICPADSHSHPQHVLNKNAADIIRRALEEYDAEPNEVSLIQKILRNL